MAQPILPRPVRALAALAALLVLAGCKADTAPAPKSERPVQIQRVSFQDADRAREFVGVVRPRYETSASVSPARSSPASSISAIVSQSATWWRASIPRI